MTAPTVGPAADAATDVVFVARDLELRPSCSTPGTWLASWGEGSERETLEVAPEVAEIIVALPQSIPAAQLAERFSALMPAAEATGLVDYLRANGLLLGDHEPLPAAERRLLEMNWADALVLHRATRGIMWRHEYPQDAQIMTWTNRDVPVPVTEPRPQVRYDDLTDTVRLPEPQVERLGAGISDVFAKRRTKRSFKGTVVPDWALSTLLHIAFRPIIQGPNRRYFTTLSSADGYREKAELSPITAHVLFGSPGQLDGQEDAVYRYNPETHALQTLRGGSLPGYFRFSELLWGQDFADEAGVGILLSVNWPQFQWKYRTSHAYRFAHYDLGAYMQTAVLAATALDMGAFITPAINDVKVARLLGATEHVSAPAYFLALGMGPTSDPLTAAFDD